MGHAPGTLPCRFPEGISLLAVEYNVDRLKFSTFTVYADWLELEGSRPHILTHIPGTGRVEVPPSRRYGH